MRKYVIGDIHGHCEALMQVLKKSGFNNENDLLISLGDVVDLGPDSPAVIEILKNVNNFIHVLGNHDYWCLNWMKNGKRELIWELQGGLKTIDAYRKNENLIDSHISFLQNAIPYYMDEESRLFVHGGFIWELSIEEQSTNIEFLTWDRSLAQMSYYFELQGKKLEPYYEIYLGHTPTRLFGRTKPVKHSNIWLMDTGCGRGGKLSMMDIDTKESWQSDEIF
jgi:serine/threonine protein phosphatase 1